MNNLTTRKIVLGLLVMLVLAFSVQGIADAVTFPGTTKTITTPTGDGLTVFPGQKFDVSFSITLGADTANPIFADIREGSPTHKGYSLVANMTHYRDLDLDGIRDDGVIDPNYLDGDDDTNSDGTLDAADPAEVWMSRSAAYYFNNEAITITAAGGPGALIDKVGTYDFANVFSVTLQEARNRPDGASELPAGTTILTVTVFVPLNANAGEVTITVTDTTTASDYPTGTTVATLDSFKVYVLDDDTASPPVISTVSSGTVLYNRPTPIRVTLASGNPWYPIYLKVESGPGTLSVTPGGTAGRTLNTFTLSGSNTTVYLNPNSGTNTIRVWVAGTLPEASTAEVVTYFFGGFNLDTDLRIDGPGGNGQTAPMSTQLPNPFVVKVIDGSRSGIPNQEVKFDITISNSEDEDALFPHSDFLAEPPATSATVGNSIDGYDPLVVKTNNSGEAKVYLKLGPIGTGNSENYTVTATSSGVMRSFTATAIRPTIGTRILTVDSEKSAQTQSVAIRTALSKPLVVRVLAGGVSPIAGEYVRFTASTGTLSPRRESNQPASTITAIPNDSQDRTVLTNAFGEAWMDYIAGDSSGRVDIYARLYSSANGAFTRVDSANTLTFTINVGGSGGSGNNNNNNNVTDTITLTLSSTTGEPGDEIDVTVTSSSSGDFVVIDDGDFSASDFDDLSGTTPHETTLILPDEEGEYDFFAVGPGGVTSNEVTVTVETGILGEISISQIGTLTNGVQTFSITVRDTDGDLIAGSLSVRVTGPGVNRSVPTANGSGAVDITLPTASGLHTFTASAEGYTSVPTQARGTGTTQQEGAEEDEEEEETVTASVPDSISIIGPSTRSGMVNEALEAALIVQVLDDDGDGLEGARVFYRVTGRGRISDGSRGGRSVGVVTDDDGYARANFTPTAGGTHTVRVNTDDVSRIVTFTITTGSAPSASGARDSGTGGTPGTISPVVHVGAASRPPMLWVDGGAIYALVGASPQRFAPGVDNALNIAIGGGKVYWTEKTGESGGTINSANLNGSDVAELTSIKAVPMGIAVDVAGSKLYWTNSRGRIQSADLDGSGITNVMQNLQSPMDLALAGGNAYWTQGNGSVRFVNLRGQKVVRNVSTGTDTPGSLVIGGGKVYWTEMTGESGGTVNSANLNGTGATPLASILAAPIGIAVDGSRSKLYWTNARGRVQSANLDGSGITNVVSGLGSPGELVLSNSIATPTATTTTTRTTATASKYDLNSDGTVDNTDAGLVADAMGTSNARYDVNGDGTVNFLDLLLVFDNRDAGAAGAPTIVGMKLSAAQIDIIEEQIDLLIATNDRSPSAMRVLVYLQQLLVTARPEKTQLLANYPNPFNPETWIPYELATDTDVRLTIYNTQGVVIRTLQLGHQSAGYYTGRDRAAYWDGRNALGEQVASGLYFYQLETDEMSLMRKMVILK